MKKGFTLAELLGVVVIISVLALLVLPPIVNQITKQESKTSEATIKLIGEAMYLYMDSNKDDYKLDGESNYCVTLQQLVDSDILTTPIRDTNGDNYPLNYNVIALVTSKTNIEYIISEDCVW